MRIRNALVLLLHYQFVLGLIVQLLSQKNVLPHSFISEEYLRASDCKVIHFTKAVSALTLRLQTLEIESQLEVEYLFNI